jgi:hypothetical protein
MGGLGLRELVVVIIAAVVWGWPFGRVFSRAGYSPWFGLFMVVPLVNIIALWMFAYAKWPALPERAGE